MSISKKLLAVAAVTALTAATAVPAMALENDFHGLFRLKGIMGNFETGSVGFFTPAADNPAGRKADTKTYLEQRTRLVYTAKANDDLKLVTHFELDSRFGDNSYTTGRNLGGGIGADTTNIETKSAYLDFNIPTAVKVNVKAGIQPMIDSYKGIIFNTDASAVVASTGFGPLKATVGFSRFDDKGSPLNRQARDLVLADAKYAVTKDISVGGSYYVLNDDSGIVDVAKDKPYANLIAHMLGVNAAAKVGPVALDGFFIYQFGNLEGPGAAKHLSAFAGNVGAKMKLGPGTITTSALYISGEGGNNPAAGSGTSNGFQTVNNVNSAGFTEHAYYAADMRILLRDKYAQNSDRAIVYDLNNKDQGLIAGFIGYNLPVGKLFVNANAGFAAVAKDNSNRPSGVDNRSNYIGTEINAEVGYKLYDNMTASLQGGYVLLGDYFKGTGTGGLDPSDPYTSRVVLQYVF